MMSSILSGNFGALHLTNAPLVVLLIKATLILLCALGVTVVMHRAAAGARHIVWLVTLGGLLLVPALTVWSPVQLRILPAQAAAVNTPITSLPLAGPARNVAPGVAPGVAVEKTVVDARPASARTPTGKVTFSSAVRATNPIVFLFGVWFAVTLAIGISLAYATVSLHRIVRASAPLNSPDWLNAIWELSDRLGLSHTPRLRMSAATKMPFACGLFRPTIVLPVESDGWSHERRRAVLLHELAHIRRHDLIGHTLGRAACAVYWFHPLVWTAAKRLRSESERACDDLALMCGTHAADYAEHLLEIVTSVRRDRTPMVALAMARRKEFEGRMLAILDPQLERATPSRWKTGALVGSLSLLSLVIGAATPVPQSQSSIPAHAPDRSVKTVRSSAEQSHVRADSVDSFGDIASRFAAHVSDGVIAHLSVALPSVVRTAESDATHAMAPVDDMIGALPDIQFGATIAGKTPDERAQLLAKILGSDTSATLRHTAAWGLAQYADSPIASAALARALHQDASARVRETSAWALARDHDAASTVITALVAALRSDASDSVRATSAWSLGQLRNVTAASAIAAPALTAALADRSSMVRMRAVWAIGALRPSTAPRALVAKLADSDSAVRELTAWALFRIRDTTTIAALQSALRTETSKDLQVDYVRALGAMGDKSLGAIRSLLESSDARTKTMAVDILAGGEASGPWPWPWPDPRPFP